MKITNKYLIIYLLSIIVCIWGITDYCRAQKTSIDAKNNSSGNEPSRPIFAQALKAFGEKNYKLAAELGAKSADTEGRNDNDFLITINWWTSRAYGLDNNADKSFEYLERAVDLGYGKDGAFLALKFDFVRKILYDNPKWNDLVNRSRNNFVKNVSENGDSLEIQLLKVEDQYERNWLPTFLEENPNNKKQILQNLFQKDKARQRKLKGLVKAKKLRSYNDYMASALIFQHSINLQDLKLAAKLAQQAMQLAQDNKQKCKAGWFIGATTDRLLWSQGKPQIYGTQSRPENMSFEETLKLIKEITEATKKGEIPKNITPPNEGTKLTKEPFDKTKVTNEERTRLCIQAI